ncbi:MAG: ABC transporter substrate-binding protein [Bifidobacteriaceae bacterium]|jgi:ABC-type glycerol-3-phosphate transport system substrate-binding protein|nr:ABC transporter substrate-binding protein [Bifidobacteriaceae bacterium]
MPQNTSKAARRAAAILVTAGLLVAGASACGDPDKDTPTDSATQGQVTWWGWTPAEQVIADTYINAFNEEYPDIEVTFKQVGLADYQSVMRPALASDQGPDLFGIAPGVTYGLFAQFGSDMTAAIEEALGSDWKSKLLLTAADPLIDENGELKAVPVGLNYAGPVWINQEMFDRYGLEPPTTFDEWVDVCAEFKAQGAGCFVHGAQDAAFNRDIIQAIADTIKPGLFADVLAGEEDWTQPEIIQAFAAWERMFSDGIMEDGAQGVTHYPDANNMFLSQQYAMIQMGQWYAQYATKAVMVPAIEGAGVSNPEPFTVVPIAFPAAYEDGTPGAWFGAADYGLAVSKKARNPKAATTFAIWLTTSAKGQQLVADQLNNIPALASVSTDWQAAGLVNPDVQREPIEELIGECKQSTEGRGMEHDPAVIDSLGQAASAVAAGEQSPADAVEWLQETLQG